MCGIIGHTSQIKAIDQMLFDQMRDSLKHRGPDDAYSVYLNNGQIALGHRRLSFLDLSAAGRQPMCNEDGTIWIVLNGEIYNYIELRETLVQAGHQFKSHSDTEVIIHGYEQWGIDVISKLKGMFAFGLLDLRKSKQYLVRDRFGIKPLYYRHDSSGLTFASELKAILTDTSVRREIDFSSFTDYFVYRYIPSPKTIWKGINKIPPANYLEYDIQGNSISIKNYWTIPFGNKNISEQDLIEAFGHALDRSVTIHARSDVPVGSFLSGGYDSSAIVYYLTKEGFKPDTFSIGFEGWDNSEDQFAAIVADRFKVPLQKTIADRSSLQILDTMAEVYDEPIADISIIPTWMVSQSAAKKVKAVMSGEGADELLGGYSWQKAFFAQKHVSFVRRIKDKWNGGQLSTVDYYAGAMAMGRFDKKELSQLLTPAYQQYIPSDTEWFYRQNFDDSLSPLQSIQRMDIKCFMGELVLTKIDRASMAHSLEVRVPFLDHEIFESVLQAREQNYFKRDKTKFLLFENIKNKMPDKILQRGKQGFVGPDSYYMDIDFYRQTLDKSRLIGDGIVREEYYLQLIANQDHWRLWKLIVMEKWYRHWCA